jgi:hypothetical protein
MPVGEFFVAMALGCGMLVRACEFTSLNCVCGVASRAQTSCHMMRRSVGAVASVRHHVKHRLRGVCFVHVLVFTLT